ncbi:hypothetical protein MLD38_016929 [Melastoma candidum]|uniref:Uncharacterized protein n=1 Tax=Melastoma candidum TaxID=119954 RepID=A0ACB9QQ68_9MYRT|nr:hypothetical protein MLD38_016929 [Melastoma candidum]
MGSMEEKWNEVYSVIGEKEEIPFIDYQDDKSVCTYEHNEGDPLIISSPFSLMGGKPRSVIVGEMASESISITNNSDETIDIWGIKIYTSTPADSFYLSVMDPSSVNFMGLTSLEDRVLQSKGTLTVWLSCKPREIGLHTVVVHFDVGGDVMERIGFLVADDRTSQSLSSKKPYSRHTKKKLLPMTTQVVASRPSRATNRRYKRKLAPYHIPTDVRELIENKQIPDAIYKGLTKQNYASFFKNLLYMEEIQLEENMRSFDMEKVGMKRKGLEYLTLEVPGLAERRPSLVHGDYVTASFAPESVVKTSKSYQGFVYRVEANVVYLKFAKEFYLAHLDGNLYNIQFAYNRIITRRLYQAVEAAMRLEETVLFPSRNDRKRLIQTTPLVPTTCILDEEQICAVEKILGCKGVPPYVIYGPPGTGKTMTIVETVTQLYLNRKDARILICTPSNSAADHILESLIEKVDQIQDHEIFRLNAANRSYDDVNPDHVRFCFYDEEIFKCPPLRALLRYYIIISTYMSVSLLHAEDVEPGHFSHIFLDEAGPVVFSRNAEKYGLGKSYLERLFGCKFYVDGDENYVTKLVRNYRCHPAILKLPSDQFYDGELIPCKDNTSFLSFSTDIVPNQDFPVLFIGVQGCDEREGNNPSWFNRIEVSKVIEVIRRLLEAEDISQKDIGVITPYRQQVLKLRNMLESLDLVDIKIGSVEQFQGQERQVIIVSTVRSTVRHNDFDKVHCLGFLTNPKRFNVAITRAMSLVIVIGNPHIICKDPYWNTFLWYCVDNNSYQGCPLPDRTESVLNEPSRAENSFSVDENDWGEGPHQPDAVVPGTNEDEWSDGWK